MTGVYLPSALRVTRTIKDSVVPQLSPSELWEKAKESEKALQDHVHFLLRDAAAYFKSSKFTDITSTMDDIVDTTATFRGNIKDALDARHVTFDTLTRELEGIFMGIVNNLEKIPSPDKAPGHAERAELVDKVLDETTLAFINLATCYGIEEEVVTTYMFALKPHVHALTVAVGDINEQYPRLLPFLVFSISVLLTPESSILKPFLSMLGFGPMGPVKDSVASLSQRHFWGAAVEADSWFSWFQAAGMGTIPDWAAVVTKAPLLFGSLLATFRRG